MGSEMCIRDRRTFKEIGKVYVEAGGDDIYHDKLEPEVLKLPIKYEEDIL